MARLTKEKSACAVLPSGALIEAGIGSTGALSPVGVFSSSGLQKCGSVERSVAGGPPSRARGWGSGSVRDMHVGC